MFSFQSEEVSCPWFVVRCIAGERLSLPRGRVPLRLRGRGAGPVKLPEFPHATMSPQSPGRRVPASALQSNAPRRRVSKTSRVAVSARSAEAAVTGAPKGRRAPSWGPQAGTFGARRVDRRTTGGSFQFSVFSFQPDPRLPRRSEVRERQGLVSGFRFQVSGVGCQDSGIRFRLPRSDFRLSAGRHRLWSLDSRLRITPSPLAPGSTIARGDTRARRPACRRRALRHRPTVSIRFPYRFRPLKRQFSSCCATGDMARRSFQRSAISRQLESSRHAGSLGMVRGLAIQCSRIDQ